MAFIQKTVTEEHVFGQDLRELRELRGWTREHLAKATGIRPSLIAAFEDGDWDRLEDPEYAERHVKLLVGALEGNVPFMLGKYRLALQAAQALKNDRERLSFVRRLRRSELFTPSRYLAFLLLFPPIVLIGWYVWKQGSNVTSPPPLEVYEPQDQAEVMDPHVSVAGLTDAAATVMVNGKTAVVGPTGEFSIVVDVPRGTTKLDIVALKRYGGRNEAVRYITFVPPAGPELAPQPVSAATTTGAATTTVADPTPKNVRRVKTPPRPAASTSSRESP